MRGILEETASGVLQRHKYAGKRVISRHENGGEEYGIEISDGYGSPNGVNYSGVHLVKEKGRWVKTKECIIGLSEDLIIRIIR